MRAWTADYLPSDAERHREVPVVFERRQDSRDIAMFDGSYGAHRIGVAEIRRRTRLKIVGAFLLGVGCTAVIAALTGPSAEGPQNPPTKPTASSCGSWPYRDQNCAADKNAGRNDVH